jgi:hypothetical protein
MSTRPRLLLWQLASFVLILFSAQAVRGQTQPVNGEQTSIPLNYHFPTNQQMLQAYLRDTFGPRAFLQSAFAAITNHVANDPPEWGRVRGRTSCESSGRRSAGFFGVDQSHSRYLLIRFFHQFHIHKRDTKSLTVIGFKRSACKQSSFAAT